MYLATKRWAALFVLLLLTGFTTGCGLFQDEPAQVAEKFLRAAVANDLADLQETVDLDQRDQVMQAILLQMGLSAFVGGAQSEYTELKVTTTSNDGQRAVVHATGKFKTVTLGTPLTVPVDIQIPLVKKQGRWYVTSSATTMQPSALPATNPPAESQQTQSANTVPITQGPNLQATIDTLQTQVVSQQAPTLVHPQEQTPTSVTAAIGQLIIGKWEFAGGPPGTIEFFQDGTFVIEQEPMPIVFHRVGEPTPTISKQPTPTEAPIITKGKFTVLGSDHIRLEITETSGPQSGNTEPLNTSAEISNDGNILTLRIDNDPNRESLIYLRVRNGDTNTTASELQKLIVGKWELERRHDVVVMNFFANGTFRIEGGNETGIYAILRPNRIKFEGPYWGDVEADIHIISMDARRIQAPQSDLALLRRLKN